jgi:hypothetical protein
VRLGLRSRLQSEHLRRLISSSKDNPSGSSWEILTRPGSCSSRAGPSCQVKMTVILFRSSCVVYTASHLVASVLFEKEREMAKS